MHGRKVPLSLPARMSRSSWFVGPSCRDVAMFIPGLELLLHIDLHREQRRQGRRRNPRPKTRRATDTHSRTRSHSDAQILARPPTGSRGRPASRRRAEKPHHLTAGAAAAAASTGNAILPPRAQTGSPGRPPRERPGPRRETPEAGNRPRSRGQEKAPRQEEAHFTLCGIKVFNCPHSGKESLIKFSSWKRSNT